MKHASPDRDCLFGLSRGSSWEESAVVVPAVYREWGYPVRPPDWLAAQAVVYQYQRLNASGVCYAENVGYESGVYLRFIVDHYDHLPRHTVFVQADWFAQDKQQKFPYKPFDLWQLSCTSSRMSQNLSHRSLMHLWDDWMPLGVRHTVWPPYQVRRVADFFASSYRSDNGHL